MIKTLSPIFLFIVVLLLSACVSSSNTIQNNNKQSLYDRVMQSGKIRCAYFIYPPGSIKDPNTGKLSGSAIEAMELVAKKLGLKVEWTEEVGWATMIEGLQTNRYDMMGTPVWTNADRAKLAGFSKPLYYSPAYVYVRKGDDRFKNDLEKINSPNVKIATIDGETAQVIAAADFPEARKLSMPQMTDVAQLLLNVVDRKADVTIAEPILAGRYLRNNPNSIARANNGKPIRVFPNCWMFKRGEFEFKAMLDTVLDEVINSGAMDKIISKYEEAPNQVYRIALPYKLPK